MDAIFGAFKSKTVWFAFLLAVLTWIQTTLNGAGLTADQLAIVGPVVSALIVWLRSVTTVPLSDK
jgi:hypothetical protein